MASTQTPKPHVSAATEERAEELSPDDIEEGDVRPRARPIDVSPDDLDDDVGDEPQRTPS